MIMKDNIEISPYGNMLVYKKGYTPSLVKKTIDKYDLDGLRIFDHLDRLDSLHFLQDYVFLKGLDISCIDDQDFSFLKNLPNLKNLGIGLSVKENNIIDLNWLRNLEKLAIQWRSGKILGLENCQTLTSLYLFDFKEYDFSAVSKLINLEKLVVKTSTVKTTNGLQNMHSLKSLWIANCKRLKSINDITGLKELTSLKIELCPQINDYDAIGELSKLESLRIIDCKEVNSIKFIQKLNCLNELALLGTTDITDGDTMPAKSIKNAVIRHRKHYNVKIETRRMNA